MQTDRHTDGRRYDEADRCFFLQFLQMPLKMCTTARYIFSTACYMSPIYLQKYRRTKAMSMDSNHKCVTIIKESQKELMLVQQVN